MIRCLLLLLASLAVLAACGDSEPVRRVDLSNREEIVIKKRPFEVTYAYLPQYSHVVSFRRHHRMVEYLERATGIPFRQVFPSSFDDHMTMFGQGLIDISYSNPFVYTKIARQNGAKAFAKIIEPGKGTFSGQIITRRDNQTIKSIEDCRGKRWIATDPSSAGGYLFPLGLFWDHGLRPEDFAEIAFAGGNQEKVVFSVYNGEYDIGSIRNGTLDIVASKLPISEIRVIAESQPYPNWVYAARGGLDPGIVARIREAMLALDPSNPEHREILQAARIARIIAASDPDFDKVRELLSRVDVPAMH